MSTIRAYLEETRAREGDKGWLRRDPRTTHPEILQTVREFRDAGGFYDDDAVRHVENIAGELDDELRKQLGHECYLAKGILRDEESAAHIAAASEQGFRPLDEVDLQAGKRYTVRCGTQYVGQSVPSFGRPMFVRGQERPGGGVGFVRKGARNFVHIPTPTIIREGWE